MSYHNLKLTSAFEPNAVVYQLPHRLLLRHDVVLITTAPHRNKRSSTSNRTHLQYLVYITPPQPLSDYYHLLHLDAQRTKNTQYVRSLSLPELEQECASPVSTHWRYACIGTPSKSAIASSLKFDNCQQPSSTPNSPETYSSTPSGLCPYSQHAAISRYVALFLSNPKG